MTRINARADRRRDAGGTFFEERAMTLSRILNELEGRLRVFAAACAGVAFFAAWLLRRATARLAGPPHGSLAELDSLRRSGAL